MAIEDKKYVKAFILYLCSTQFHVTAFIFLPIYFFISRVDRCVNLTREKKIIITITIFIILYMLKPIFETTFLGLNTDSSINTLSNISELETIDQYGFQKVNPIYLLLCFFIYLLNLICNSKESNRFVVFKNEYSIKLINLFYYIFIIFACFYSVLYFRISDYFLPFVVVGLSNKFVLKRNLSNGLKLLVLIIFVLFFVVNTMGPNINYIREYSFWRF